MANNPAELTAWIVESARAYWGCYPPPPTDSPAYKATIQKYVVAGYYTYSSKNYLKAPKDWVIS